MGNEYLMHLKSSRKRLLKRPEMKQQSQYRYTPTILSSVFHTPQNPVTPYPGRSPDFRSLPKYAFSAGRHLCLHANGLMYPGSLYTVTGSFRTCTGFPINFSRKPGMSAAAFTAVTYRHQKNCTNHLISIKTIARLP